MHANLNMWQFLHAHFSLTGEKTQVKSENFGKHNFTIDNNTIGKENLWLK